MRCFSASWMVTRSAGGVIGSDPACGGSSTQAMWCFFGDCPAACSSAVSSTSGSYLNCIASTMKNSLVAPCPCFFTIAKKSTGTLAQPDGMPGYRVSSSRRAPKRLIWTGGGSPNSACATSWTVEREDGCSFQVEEQGGNEGERSHRVAELLRVVSQVTADLAAEFDTGDRSAARRTPRGIRRRHKRVVAAPEHVTDLDVAAARRATLTSLPAFSMKPARRCRVPTLSVPPTVPYSRGADQQPLEILWRDTQESNLRPTAPEAVALSS
jgi:hypothetical protein